MSTVQCTSYTSLTMSQIASLSFSLEANILRRSRLPRQFSDDSAPRIEIKQLGWEYDDSEEYDYKATSFDASPVIIIRVRLVFVSCTDILISYARNAVPDANFLFQQAFGAV